MDFAIWLLTLLILVVPGWVVCTKAGLKGPIALVILIPVIGYLIFLFVVAYSGWPSVDGRKGEA